MRKAVIVWLIIAVCLVILGMAVLGWTACSMGWDFSKLDAGRYETNIYEMKEEFSNISINTDTANIVFAPSDDENCKVVCYEEKNMKHSVSAADGVLMVNVVDTRKWYEHISWFASPKIIVYLPETQYSSLIIEEKTGDIEIPKDFRFVSIDISVSTGNVKSYACVTEAINITTSTGDVCVEDVSAGTLDLSASTGKITASDIICEGDVRIVVSTGKTIASDIQCKNLTSTGSTGDISLRNVIATQKLSIMRSTGDVKFDGCDAAEIFVETKTGGVTGTLLSEKIFITKTSTGDMDVPHTTTGGKCEITTSTGNIKLQIK